MILVGFCLKLAERREVEARRRRSCLKRISSFDSERRLDRRESGASCELWCDCGGDAWALGITHAYAEQSHYRKVYGEGA